MISLVFEFDGATPLTLALFEALPEALAGRSVLVDYRPAATLDTPAWMGLLAGEAPGRWVCGEVLRRGPVDALEVLGPSVRRTPGMLPAATGAVPAIVWDGRRFSGDHALDALTAALPPV